MPWREVSLMDQRREFILLFQQTGVNRRELCRRFGVSSKTAYKWLARAAAEGKDWAQDRSRRPRKSPARSAAKNGFVSRSRASVVGSPWPGKTRVSPGKRASSAAIEVSRVS